MAAIDVRPPRPAAVTKPKGLHLSLFGDLQRVVDLDSELSHRALKFRMAEAGAERPKDSLCGDRPKWALSSALNA
jgi:hypothetical protein